MSAAMTVILAFGILCLGLLDPVYSTCITESYEKVCKGEARADCKETEVLHCQQDRVTLHYAAVCAPVAHCGKGTYARVDVDECKVFCEYCPDHEYQPTARPSNESKAPQCQRKRTSCNSQTKATCPRKPDRDDSCRCLWEDGYRPANTSCREGCFEEKDPFCGTCERYNCPEGQQLNASYQCVQKPSCLAPADASQPAAYTEGHIAGTAVGFFILGIVSCIFFLVGLWLCKKKYVTTCLHSLANCLRRKSCPCQKTQYSYSLVPSPTEAASPTQPPSTGATPGTSSNAVDSSPPGNLSPRIREVTDTSVTLELENFDVFLRKLELETGQELKLMRTSPSGWRQCGSFTASALRCVVKGLEQNATYAFRLACIQGRRHWKGDKFFVATLPATSVQPPPTGATAGTPSDAALVVNVPPPAVPSVQPPPTGGTPVASGDAALVGDVPPPVAASVVETPGQGQKGETTGCENPIRKVPAPESQTVGLQQDPKGGEAQIEGSFCPINERSSP